MTGLAPPRLAPIAFFAFKRPEHTRRALEALALNPEFERSALFIFCDGARRPDEAAAVEATRQVVRNWPHPDKTVREAPANRGLAASIIDGVSELCALHGRVIVVEDDLVVAPVFLDFLNRGLDAFADDSRVLQVSGHMFSVELALSHSDAVLLPFITSWGWATWARAWAAFDGGMSGYERLAADHELQRRFDLDDCYPFFAMLKKQRAGLIDSWAIRWYLSVFIRNGLAVYPRHTLVNNAGFDGSGTHGATTRWGLQPELQSSTLLVDPQSLTFSAEVTRAVAMHMRATRGNLRLMSDWCRRRLARLRIEINRR